MVSRPPVALVVVLLPKVGSSWYSALDILVVSTISGFIAPLLLIAVVVVVAVVAAALVLVGRSSTILFLQVGQLALTLNHSSTHCKKSKASMIISRNMMNTDSIEVVVLLVCGKCVYNAALVRSLRWWAHWDRWDTCSPVLASHATRPTPHGEVSRVQHHSHPTHRLIVE